MVQKFVGGHSHTPSVKDILEAPSKEWLSIKIPRVSRIQHAHDNLSFQDESPSEKTSEIYKTTENGTAKDSHKLISSLRGLLAMVALSVHSLFEGMAVGLEETSAGVWQLFLAIAIHSTAIAFCVGTGRP